MVFLMLTVLVLILSEVSVLAAKCTPGICGPGEMLSGEKCTQCPHGSYMDIPNHGCESCINCSPINDNGHEVALKSCTATSDTIIGCMEGFYRKKFSYGPGDVYCSECTDCRHNAVIETCTATTDTKCADAPVSTTVPLEFTDSPAAENMDTSSQSIESNNIDIRKTDSSVALNIRVSTTGDYGNKFTAFAIAACVIFGILVCRKYEKVIFNKGDIDTKGRHGH